ncbi:MULTISPECIES: glycine--tRNA ligase subunit beta [unclassified Novosphingobium]|uniref:glycine--tRNA ligase subunit beta n=1 Tax=unclassified Novosphingobium TaxID=2644732 RepID=UPI00086DD3B5|nr:MULTISPECIES: glycine--tRNA ligase subunit beta [unclassified Novosphingobium]MBN9143490.1 glycine--tRNA ligase subunit beta [Novosphingobium sp.]MDR6706739.1 glycyl-tRNA synthetase beta chain [Novosphingobium sp. 1748]ODU83741.1 MAG: glycine--tRNA ligase subunit beta [Novosphingobium sp. SCN 63-17]OJX92678.1 MAG: glycine--tRNA ligase subunit beta [Novosphingobium sp. 63-713]
MSDFLLELRSEEIPARMQAGARAELEKLFRGQMAAAGVAVGELTLWSTPRRLALIARGLPVATQAVREEVKGPKASAPEQALAGFLRKTGLTREQLEERDGVFFAVTEKPGRATADVLAEAIPAIVRGFAWPKSQRWGAASLSTESLRWVRPLQGIIALLDGAVVPCEVGGIVSGRETVGHRFHSSGAVSVADADSYADDLRAAHVLVNHEERQDIIRAKAKEVASAAGLTLVEDEGLVIENAGLTEWPQPLLGRFDEAFLEVPPEVIQLTARINQKYFVCEDAAGKLANAFVCTANIDAIDGGEGIIAGNRKVLAARLSDARFFWQQDLKTPLAVQAKKLERITFHEKLGTVAQRQERFVALTGAFQGALADSVDHARAAAAILKADLVTEMVGEFPELQGLMGGYYAAAEGLPAPVVAGIRDHYKPAGQSDELPVEGAAILTAIIDKVDALVGFFGADLKPTGSKDPFALRRAALGVIRLITENGLRLNLLPLFEAAAGLYRDQGVAVNGAADDLLTFFADRLKVQQKEAGVRHDLIDAVFALGGEDDLVRLLARVHALQAFVQTDDGKNLLAGYKRAANILKAEEKKGWDAGVTNPAPEPAEAALMAALADAAPRAEKAVADEDFTGAMAALASLRSAVDEFFNHVIVNADNPDIRSARLGLLSQLRAATHKVADFSRIEG